MDAGMHMSSDKKRVKSMDLDPIFSLLRRSVNSKLKKWALLTIIFLIIFSLDDYSVATLKTPNIDQLKISE
ncbi:MAG: hypothetical protein WC733_04515, partial [Methylophilus sp.]